MKRILTAIVLVPVLILVIGYAPGYLFTLLVATAAVLSLDEFFGIVAKSGVEIYRVWGHVLGICLILSFHVSPLNQTLSMIVLILSVFLLLAWNLRTSKSLPEAIPGSALTTLGLIYVPASLGLLIALHSSHTLWGEGSRWVFFLLIVVWFGDTAAYYIGGSLGKHLLAPNLSPKKTVEGAWGGLLGSALAAVVSKKIFLPQASLVELILLALVIGVVSQIGDLSESALKRAAGVKDSSKLLPGHGGMLDRIDGVLFGSPILFVYVRFLLKPA
ncbi:MAG: phosphatidate cytidylyltransferase [Terriglobia bacterium]